MYTIDGRRFEVPLAYLATTVFGKLLRMSLEFGFRCDSGIILPFDAGVRNMLCAFSEEMHRKGEGVPVLCVLLPCQYSGCTVTNVALHQQLAVCTS
jgi:hypothetical protein